MTHEDFIVEVAKRLEWTEEKTAGIIETILDVMSMELKMNNPMVIDDFGTLKTEIQSEYILVNRETKERYLMPPAMEVVFEALFHEDEDNSLLRASFTPDEVLYDEVNSSFSQFEPTPLNEGVQFPGIPEIIAGEPEEESGAPESPHPPSLQPEEDPESGIPEEEMESVEFEVVAEEAETVDPPEITEPEKIHGRIEPFERVEPAGMKESPPKYRSRRELRSNKKTSSVWIPIAGGIAIVMASLFFFKGDTTR